MMQAGSTYRPSWRASAHALALAVALGALTAGAETQVLSVPGTPVDVQVWRPGVFSVATSTHAVLFSNGTPIRTQSVPNGAVSTWLGPGNCFVWLDRQGRLGSVDCTTPPASALAADIIPLRMRLSPGGVGYAVGSSSSSESLQLYGPSGVFAGPWQSLQLMPTSPPSGALDAVTQGTIHHALLGFVDRNVLWLRNQVPTATYSLSASGVPQAMDLFSVGDTIPPYAVVGTSSVPLLRWQLRLGGSAPQPVTVPAGLSNVSGLDLNVCNCGSNGVGFGFGMAVAQQGGQRVVLGAVPVSDPNEAGKQWLLNPALTSRADLDEVSCASAATCVVTRARADRDNLILYTNRNAPQLSMRTSVVLDEGQADVVQASATDVDGDPVLLVVDRQLSGPDVSMSWRYLDGGVQMDFQAGSVCQDVQLANPPRVYASDGLNEPFETVQVRVRHTVPPLAPQVPWTTVVSAGGERVRLQATATTSPAGCTPSNLRWEVPAGSLPLAGTDGGVAYFDPPAVLCSQEPLLTSYRAIATDSAGDSPAATATVEVQPWGVPEPPLGPDAGVEVVAGQRVLLERQQAHACASEPGFPGVETAWRLEQGQELPAGVRLVGEDGGTTAPWSGRVWVESERCIERQVRLLARNYTRDDAGTPGPEAPLSVDVRPRTEPLSSLSLSLARTSEAGVSELEVEPQASVECPGWRDLRVRLHVERDSGEPLGQPETIRLGQRWRQSLPQGCVGGLFRVRGTLVDGQTGETGGSGELEVETAQLPLRLEPLPEEVRLVARCGEGARGTLTQVLAGPECPQARVSWAQVEGPALAQPQLTGMQVEVATQDTLLQELAGQSLALRVRAEAGTSNVAEREHRVPIVVEPFVEVRHEAEVPTVSDTGLVGLSVHLTNTTACPVGGLELRERLAGLAYMDGSARFEGHPVEVRWEEGVLTVRGLSLEAHGSGTLTYVARPRVLGEGQARAEVLLNGALVSLGQPAAPPAGCGCTGSGSGPWGLGLLALALLRPRRPLPPEPARSSRRRMTGARPR